MKTRSLIVTLAIALGLCLWLRADTKPQPEPTETQMMTVDAAFTALFPELPNVGLMAKDLRLSVEDLDTAEENVEGLYLLWQSLDTRVDAIESELEATP